MKKCGQNYKDIEDACVLTAHEPDTPFAVHFFYYPFEDGTAAVKWTNSGTIMTHRWAQKQPDGTMKIKNLLDGTELTEANVLR